MNWLDGIVLIAVSGIVGFISWLVGYAMGVKDLESDE